MSHLIYSIFIGAGFYGFPRAMTFIIKTYEEKNQMKKDNKTIDNQENISPEIIEAGKTSVLSMDSLTQNEELPDVQPHAIDAIKSAKNDQVEQAKKELGFDPEIHATNSDGTPKLTKAGKPQKKRGRKSGSVLNAKKKAETAQPEITEISSMEAGVVVSGLLEQMSVKLISDEWAYNDVERAGNVTAWAQTFDSFGGVKLSPVQMLMMSHAQIILTRIPQPKTKTKIGLIKAWWKHKKSKWRNKKNAHTDNRKDAIGENDVREEEGAQPTKTGN